MEPRAGMRVRTGLALRGPIEMRAVLNLDLYDTIHRKTGDFASRTACARDETTEVVTSLAHSVHPLPKPKILYTQH